MTQFISSFLLTSFVMSIIILAVLLFNTLLPNTFTAKFRYTIWLMILFGIIIPIRPVIGNGLVKIPIAESIQKQSDKKSFQITKASSEIDSLQGTEDVTEATAISTTSGGTILNITKIGIIWAIIAIMMVTYHIWRYIRFLAMIKRWGTSVKDEKVLSILQSIQKEIIPSSKKIDLKVCDFISSSMLTGFLHPVILLPNKHFDEDELILIFKHEFIHYKRHDLFVKLLSIIAISMHWFNPIVYWMCKAMQADVEASCDEAVLQDANIESRQFYAEVIIGMIGGKNTAGTMLSTCFYGGKESIKRRLSSIMDTTPKIKKTSVIALVIVFVLILFSGSVFAYAQKPSDVLSIPQDTEALIKITTKQAKDIALTTVGGGTVVNCINELKENQDIYRIEIIYSDKRYSIEIDALQSSILDYQVEAIETASSDLPDIQLPTHVATDPITPDQQEINDDTPQITTNPVKNPQEATVSPSLSNAEITAEQAKEIALKKTGGGTVIECKIDYEDGRKIYEIEIVYNNIKYEMDIDIIYGTITDYSAERVKDSTENAKYYDDDDD